MFEKLEQLAKDNKKISDFHKYKEFKKSIKPCDKSEIFNKLNFKIATDASMNIKKLKRLI